MKPNAVWRFNTALEAEIILQALETVVSKHFDIEKSGASGADIEGVDCDVADDG